MTHLEIGGAQKATINLCSGLFERNHEVFLLSSYKDNFLSVEINKLLGSKFKKLNFLKREINPIFDLLSFFSLYIYIKENKFDIVHTHMSKAGILGRWAAFLAFGPSIVHTVHGFAFHDFQNFITRKICIFIEKTTACITDKIIAVSEAVIEKGLRYGIGNKRKYVLIYEILELEKNRTALILDKKNTRIGMIAALKQQKSPEDFVKTAYILNRRRKNIEFYLIGDGRLRGKIEKMIADFDLEANFKVLGWRQDAYAIMGGFDVLVLTSIFEGQPHVLIEAFSLKIPVVATAVDGVVDLIKNDETGFLVPVHSPQKLAECIEKIIDDESIREKISQNAYDFYVKEKKMDYNFNLDRIISIYKELYCDTSGYN